MSYYLDISFQAALSMRPKKFETLFHVSVTDRTPLVFSCMAGIRSKKAASIAERSGFSDVREFSGGWVAWAEAQKH